MAVPRIGPDVAVFRLGWRRDTFEPQQISAEIHEHVVGLLRAAERGESFRSGNVLAVHVLGEDHLDPRLLFVSTDIGWSGRDQDAVDALRHATVDDVGKFTLVDAASASIEHPESDVAARDLGGRVSVYELRPAPGHRTEDLVASVAANLAPLVGAPATRSGNVQNVSLLAEHHSDRHLLIFGVDIGESERNAERLATLRQVADLTELGAFVQHPLPVSLT